VAVVELVTWPVSHDEELLGVWAERVERPWTE
jgi:hypothetical protein